MSKIRILEELRKELDATYQEMNAILERNGLSKRDLFKLPPQELNRWKELNTKSIILIKEFSDHLKQ